MDFIRPDWQANSIDSLKIQPRVLFSPLLIATPLGHSPSLPIPKTYRNKTQPFQTHFHVLIDPWPTPSNSIVPWFLQQCYVEVPACTDISLVEDLIHDIEAASGASLKDAHSGRIDAIVTVGTNSVIRTTIAIVWFGNLVSFMSLVYVSQDSNSG